MKNQDLPSHNRQQHTQFPEERFHPEIGIDFNGLLVHLVGQQVRYTLREGVHRYTR